LLHFNSQAVRLETASRAVRTYISLLQASYLLVPKKPARLAVAPR
jgi:hypothetical protein